MTHIKIATKEYKISCRSDSESDKYLYTENLDSEVAITLFSERLNKVAMGKSLNENQIDDLFSEFNPENLDHSGLIKVKIVGGDNSKSSNNYVENLIKKLAQIDNDRDIIDLTSNDTGINFHPNNLEIDCYHGGVKEHYVSKIQKLKKPFDLDDYKIEKSKSKNCNIL